MGLLGNLFKKAGSALRAGFSGVSLTGRLGSVRLSKNFSLNFGNVSAGLRGRSTGNVTRSLSSAFNKKAPPRTVPPGTI